jgi:enoyl-CoA hydratase
MAESILLARAEGIGVITVNRPEVRNALDAPAWAALRAAFHELDNDESVRAIIVTGAGDKAFVSGADLNTLKKRGQAETFLGLNSKILSEIEAIGKPTIAAINGFAMGGGLELAMACDLRICSRSAKLGQTELNLGILPGAGGTQRLTRLVGLGKARELIFTGRIIPPEEALAIGLVNQLAESPELMDKARELARGIVSKSAYILRLAKLIINTGADVDLRTGLALEKLGQTAAFGSEDHLEGISAFLEKRPPCFKGQ